MTLYTILRPLTCLFVLSIALTQPPAAIAGDGDPVSALIERPWSVDGVARTALVHIPPAATKAAAPVVFVFHGHNGNARAISRKLAIHELWPEAIVVYPQGLPSPGRFDPDGKTPGWQKSRGDQGDRDLKFFDEILTTLKGEDKLDEKRIYATGHSNGGAFTYLLSAERGTVLAAVAVCSSVAHQKEDLPAKPVLHIAGEQDPNIRFAQQQRTMEAIRKVNGCDAAGQPWTKAEGFTTTLYPSKTGTPLVTAIYPGGHAVPEGAAALIAKFFQEQPRAGGVDGSFSREDVQLGDPETGYVCIEFSPDMKYMAWVEPRSPGRNAENTVWLCAMDAETGDLMPRSGKGFKVGAVKTSDYEPSGQPQWGQDDKGFFAVILDPEGSLVVVRPQPQRGGGLSATVTRLSTPPNPSRMFPYPTRLTTPGGFVVYIQNDSGGERQLHYIDLADPTREHPITRGPHLKIGKKRLEPFIVDIPRWFYDVETRADGLPLVIYGDDTEPNPQIPFPVIEVKELDFAKPKPMPATVAKPLPVLFDPFPFLYRGERYIIAGVNAGASGVVVKPGADGQYRDVIHRFEPRGSALKNPNNLASAEPFVWRGKVYTAFQVNEPGDPGTTSAEIWLTSVLDGSVLRRVSDDTPSQRADPEFFIGKSRVWIFYFAHSGNSGRWQLRRADTGLR